MKRTILALVLALGATAAVAEPTLQLQSAQDASVWKNAPEQTTYRSDSQLVNDDAPGYPFNP